jgi:hypothetical protein
MTVLFVDGIGNPFRWNPARMTALEIVAAEKTCGSFL